MNMVLDSDICSRLVVSFGHFLWQGALIGLIFAIAMRVLSRRPPVERHLFGIICLASMAVCVPATYLWLRPTTVKQNFAADMIADGRQANADGVLEEPTIDKQEKVRVPLSGRSQPADQGIESASASAEAWQNPGSLSWVFWRDLSLERSAPILVFGYLFGSGLLLVRLTVGVVFAWRYRRASTPVLDSEILTLMNDAVAYVGLKTVPPLRWCGRVIVPSVVGVLRPVVYLPEGCAASLSASQLKQVLVHELTHIRRWDPLMSLVQNVVEALLFFHPAVWFVSRRVRLERENCCDAVAASASGSAVEYAKTLVDVASLANTARRNIPQPVGFLAFLGQRSQLTQRVDRLLGIRSVSSNRWDEAGSVVVVALSLILCLAMITDREVTAKPVADDKPDVTEPRDLKAQPGIIVGVVVDEAGEPIGGVLVDAWTWWKGSETTTDVHGQFELNPQSDGRGRAEIRFSKSDFSPQYIVQQPVGVDPIRIVMNSKTYLEGTLTDASGSRVANAVIRGEQGMKQGDGVMIGSVATETTTDENGNYRLYVFPDLYDIKVSAPQRGIARLSGISVPEGAAKVVNIELADGVRFEAKVVDAVSGEPVDGFILWSWQETQYFGKSDRDGKIVIDSMMPGPFEFNVGSGEPVKMGGNEFYQHGSFGRWWSADSADQWGRKEIQSGQFQRNFDDLKFDLSVGMKPVVIEVERGVTFRGKVLDPDGRPVAGATVAPAKTGSGNSLTGDTRYSAETKEDGSYEVVMPAGNDFQYNLVAHDGKYQEWRSWANAVTEPMVTRPGEEFTIDITLTKGATVKGKVTATDGRSLTGLEVRAHSADLLENRYYDPTTRVIDEDGNFELKFIRPGEHYIQVEPFFLAAGQAPGRSTVKIELAEGETQEGIELALVGGDDRAGAAMAKREFTVAVTDQEDKPLEKIFVFAFTPYKPSSLGFFGDRAGFAERMEESDFDPNVSITDTDGRVLLSGEKLFGDQPTSALLVAVDASGRLGAISVLSPYAQEPNQTLKLEPICDVSVKFVGDKLVGGRESMFDAGGMVYLLKDAITIASAPYTSEKLSFQLPPGDYELAAMLPNAESIRKPFNVPAKETLELEPIELSPSKLSLLIGKPAPPLNGIADWLGTDPGSLESLRGRVVILDFWGYWRGPCMTAMPELMMLHDEYESKGLTIIGIHDASVATAEQLKMLLADSRENLWGGRELPFPSAIASNSDPNAQIIADYGIFDFPTTLLIDKQGNIVSRIYVGDKEVVKKQIEKLLNE